MFWLSLIIVVLIGIAAIDFARDFFLPSLYQKLKETTEKFKERE